jgi:hypothetical protein
VQAKARLPCLGLLATLHSKKNSAESGILDPAPQSDLAGSELGSRDSKNLAIKERKVKNPLDTIWGTIISGLVLTLILYYIVKMAIGG